MALVVPFFIYKSLVEMRGKLWKYFTPAPKQQVI